MLHVRFGESYIRVRFAIGRNLAVPVLLSTTFIDKSIRCIFTGDEKIVWLNFSSVLTLVVQITESNKTKKQQDYIFTHTIDEQGFNQELNGVSPTVSPRPLPKTTVLAVKIAKDIVYLVVFTQFE